MNHVIISCNMKNKKNIDKRRNLIFEWYGRWQIEQKVASYERNFIKNILKIQDPCKIHWDEKTQDIE